MKNPPAIADNLTFKGPDADAIAAAHPDVVWSVSKLAKTMPHAAFVAYVTPRLGSEPLEWTLVVTSPAGKRTYEITQNAPTSPTLLDRRTL